MTKREELYRKFGPMLIEALTLIIKDEINNLRQKAGLPEKTNQQLMDAIEDKLNSLEEYDWMKEQI